MMERLPALAAAAMSDEQKAAAAELAAGPRGGVRGPFIARLRSPRLMQRLQKVGEYLRYESAAWSTWWAWSATSSPYRSS